MGANQSQPPSIQALPASSTLLESTFQPALDYDKDSCYAAAAISPTGQVNRGLPLSGGLSEGCRYESLLGNSNAYSRAKCNGDYCGIVYDLYFEKDQVSWGPGSAGHRHDWEHIVVWVNIDRSSPEMLARVEHVATSAHGKFTVHERKDVLFDDSFSNHAKIVYHKDGGSTHAFRKAEGHDDPPENHWNKWHYPALVGWDGYPEGIRDVISNADYGKGNFALKDSRFKSNLAKAMPGGIKFDPYGVDEFVWEPEVGELKRGVEEKVDEPERERDEL